MARRLFVLLPPSESKEVGGSRSRKAGPFDGPLEAPRRNVVASLATLLASDDARRIENTLRVHGALLERAIEASHAIVEGRARFLPAWQRYDGVVWNHLEPHTLKLEQRRRIIVPCGLLGVTTAQDPVCDYRLKMNATLSPIGGLATYWRPWITPAIFQHCEGATVVNLLPKEHATALDGASFGAHRRLVNIRFVSDAATVVAGHEAKAVKGVLARHLLDEGLGSLDSFAWQGWRVRPASDGTSHARTGAKVREIIVEFDGSSEGPRQSEPPTPL